VSAGIALLLVEALLVGLALARWDVAPDADADTVSRAARERAFTWVALVAALGGAAALAVGALGDRYASWAYGLAGVPIVYLCMQTVPRAVSGEAQAVAAFVVSASAAVVYVGVLRRLTARAQYMTCLGVLASVGLFFRLWEPPPPKALPLRQSLVDHFPRELAGWSGEHRPLSTNTEKELGADEYLSLELHLPDGRRGLIFVTYNASAWSNIPHVPWVCMEESGFEKTGSEERDVMIERFPGRPRKEIPVNVLLFEPKPGVEAPPALMLQYFNVGGTYTPSRDYARMLGTRGSFTQEGSYLSQTQVAVWLAPGDRTDPMSRSSEAFGLAVRLLNEVVPLLESEYYPKLDANGG
jgi:hypothetical protein